MAKPNNKAQLQDVRDLIQTWEEHSDVYDKIGDMEYSVMIEFCAEELKKILHLEYDETLIQGFYKQIEEHKKWLRQNKR